jgi:hypothetical protein
MELKELIRDFSGLHEQARIGALSAKERQHYVRTREELAAALLQAQKRELKEGQMARQSLRVPRTLQVDVDLAGQRQRGMTLDISIGGFAAMLGLDPPVGEHAHVTLKLPDGEAPLDAEAIVAGLQAHGGAFRVSFAFDNMPSSARERLGFLVFDVVLQTFRLM